MKNNLATHVDVIVGAVVITKVSNKEVGSIPNAALSIRVVLTRTPLPDLSIVNVGFARRMVEAQRSTRDNRDRVLEVSNASEPAIELAVDVVSKFLISDLPRNRVKLRAQESFAIVHTRGSP